MIKTTFKLEASQSTQLPPLDKEKVSKKGPQNSTHRRGAKSDADQVIT